jgi:hypothetical protein
MRGEGSKDKERRLTIPAKKLPDGPSLTLGRGRPAAVPPFFLTGLDEGVSKGDHVA